MPTVYYRHTGVRKRSEVSVDERSNLTALYLYTHRQLQRAAAAWPKRLTYRLKTLLNARRDMKDRSLLRRRCRPIASRVVTLWWMRSTCYILTRLLRCSLWTVVSRLVRSCYYLFFCSMALKPAPLPDVRQPTRWADNLSIDAIIDALNTSKSAECRIA